ncbi:hypothetical protein NFI96_013585 [Prochilodus magdalenae]|nr:hypothetical protein NFI96_013585 [Prochilodus magdalenae]
MGNGVQEIGVSPTKPVRCFPNNKPWITSDVNDLLNQKKRAFRDGNWTELKRVQGELKIRLKEAKESYRKKVERKLQDNNMKEVWGAMKTITGCKNNSGNSVDGHVDRAKQFNNFYNRFDCPAPAGPSSYLPAASTTLSSSPSPSPPPSSSPSSPSPSQETAEETTPLEGGRPRQRFLPRGTHPKELNEYRAVALTSHVMKTMERLLLNHLRSQVHHAEDLLQFAHRQKVGVEDAILYLLHRAHSHLDKGGGAVRVMFFDFSSAFNTIQPLLLRDKLMNMEVDMHLVTWITDYPSGRPQHVRIRDCSSDMVISSTGAPQGTVLSPVLFTLYTSDFKYNYGTCRSSLMTLQLWGVCVMVRRGSTEAWLRTLWSGALPTI